MNPKTLSRDRDLTAVMRRGHKQVGTSVTVHTLDRNDDQPCRTAIVVTKRMGGAVVRNRIRRRLRAAVRLVRCSGKDAVIIARPAALVEDFQNLVTELSERLGVPD